MKKICPYCKQEKHGHMPVKEIDTFNVRSNHTGTCGMVYLPKCLIGKRVKITIIEYEDK